MTSLRVVGVFNSFIMKIERNLRSTVWNDYVVSSRCSNDFISFMIPLSEKMCQWSELRKEKRKKREIT
jgi:hypothetical protein